jgi:hypothetical protein
MLSGHCVFPLPPPVWGRVGAGGGHYETCLTGVSEAHSPPTLALPHKGGGDHKACCSSVFLLIQRYWDQSILASSRGRGYNHGIFAFCARPRVRCVPVSFSHRGQGHSAPHLVGRMPRSRGGWEAALSQSHVRGGSECRDRARFQHRRDRARFHNRRDLASPRPGLSTGHPPPWMGRGTRDRLNGTAWARSRSGSGAS